MPALNPPRAEVTFSAGLLDLAERELRYTRGDWAMLRQQDTFEHHHTSRGLNRLDKEITGRLNNNQEKH